ncbi:MAG: neutral/alkaline non-lysosomal ceramidase N-terminal domain-containing protein [Gemmatimonadota bacterium]
MHRAGRLLPFLVIATSCTSLPRPVSTVPVPSGERVLKAGVARVDITPPPGGGLFGYGPEGKRADGYRMRLHARALVLEDHTGERVAFVVTDLGANSVLLHRVAAQETVKRGIGADRLLLAASHTHAGPTHHFGLAYDLLAAGDAMGFNWSWSMELGRRIATAVTQAIDSLRPARAAWVSFPVWGVTFNRNLVAYGRNKERWQSPFATPPEITRADSAIDPAWTMLRVDTRGVDGIYRPAAALSIFAMHGTGSPSANTLYDADLHGMVSQAIERGIDRGNGRSPGPAPRAVHLFAQGSEGDASAMPVDTRCPVPTLHLDEFPEHGRPGLTYRLMTNRSIWQPPDPAVMEECIAKSRERMRVVAATLAERAVREFERAAPSAASDTLRIARVFRTVYPDDQPEDFCAQPRLGTATLAGPIDGQTRFMKAGVQYVEEGGSAIDPGPYDTQMRRCQAPKRALEIKGVPLIRKLTQGRLHSWKLTPREAQLAVVRVGPQVIAMLPAEITTTAGGRIKDSLADSLSVDRRRVALMAIVNGYLNYVTTEEEYGAQYYEGSSTLFGPRSARSLRAELLEMSRLLPSPGEPSPPAKAGKAYAIVDALTVHRFPSRKQGPQRADRCIDDVAVSGDTITFAFRDLYPGRLMRTPYPLLRFEQRAPNGSWVAVAWDDDANVEVRAGDPDGERGHWWHVRWSPPRFVPDWRIVLIARDQHPEIAIAANAKPRSCGAE